jgi:hypothetical protein
MNIQLYFEHPIYISMNFTKDKLVLSRNDAMTFIDKRRGRTVLK